VTGRSYATEEHVVQGRVEKRRVACNTVDALRRCSDDDLRRIVATAKPHVLRACLYQITHDERIRSIRVSETGVDGTPAGAPVPAVASPDDVDWLRDRACELLVSYREGAVEAPLPSRLEFQSLLETFFQVEISAWETDFWWEEFAAVPHPRGCEWYGSLLPHEAEQFQVVVIGAGMGGITTAVNLERAGIPFTVIERNDGVGGTWHSNVYPGARVDINSRAYSYSWEPDWKWKHYYATQDELQAYFDHVVDKYQVRKNIQLCTEVVHAVWNEPDQQWELAVRDTRTGEVRHLEANVIISAIGLFSCRKLIDIDGIEDFQGRVMHTAEWDTGYDTAGKRIATIGTGASGVQVVVPLAAQARELYVFQRSGTWVEPVSDYLHTVPDDEQWLLDNFPFYLNWERLVSVFALNHHKFRDPSVRNIDPEWNEPGSFNAWNKGVRDRFVKYVMEKLGDRPDLVEQCIPDYPPLSKRLPKDNGWFDTLRRANVTLISDPIERITPSGIRTRSGKEYDVDLIVLATGFDTEQFLLPLDLVGRNGIKLRDRWSTDGARAYLGITIPGFPNLFCLYGPNTNGRASGPCAWGELQSRYAMEAIKYMIDNGLRSMDVKEEVYDDFNRLLDERSRYMPWMDPRQSSYYRNQFGRSATNGPFTNRDYWPWTRRPNPDDFVTVRSPARSTGPG
jgi:4-hydroxyacetophenone monooxygenase